MGTVCFGDDNKLCGNPRYEKVKDVNRGSFGFVVLALDHQTGEQVALKFIERGPANISKYVEREIINHMRLRHPHVIALREVFLTPTHLVLAMEYAAGGDLFRYVASRRGLAEPEARWFFQQMMIAIDYCHRMGVTSRDIKLENTLLDGSDRPLIKLADFGFSKDANMHSAPTSRVGTPAYLAPEVVGNQPGRVYNGQKADVWSCGVLLFVMVTNSYPFKRSGDDYLKPNQRLNTMLQRILRADFSFPEGRQLSESLRDLISRMLVLDPAVRASLQDIINHPWFMEGLNPAALQFNDSIVEESKASEPPSEVIEEVRQIVQQAATEEKTTDAAWLASKEASGAAGTDGAVKKVDTGSGGGGGSSLDDLVQAAADEADSWEFDR